jgi:hypothetical protein
MLVIMLGLQPVLSTKVWRPSSQYYVQLLLSVWCVSDPGHVKVSGSARRLICFECRVRCCWTAAGSSCGVQQREVLTSVVARRERVALLYWLLKEAGGSA